MVKKIDVKEEKKCHYHWKIRLIVALLMISFSFIGLTVSDIRQNGAWLYWRIMVPVFAVLSLSLSWYLRKNHKIFSATTIKHELAQWFGLILSVYLISIFVNIGFVGRFEAGLMVLILLALNIYIIGIYVEPSFIFIGVLLGLFSLSAAMLVEYLYTIILPITIGVTLLLIWLVRKRF